ncbi:MAG: glycerol-3-phosphate dehydrogenase/oxidase [Myxococcales bacterium]|nr:glycerol-3-phosphate dehydrogenase/oxidase [Myxococcales bacterium]
MVGAGITGAGIARDAALRGLRVLVLEASDLAFGTSSRSSRLIHGGVRYLEQGEVGLVYEALRERTRLYKTASHLVSPADFLFPAYAGDRLPLWKLRVGLALYDALSLYQSRHRTVDPAGARAREPLLADDGLRGAVIYEDAVTDDARLTLTTLQSARRYGAEILTYARVEGLGRDDAGLWVRLAGGTLVRAHKVVVAAGPWTSERLLGETGKHLLALSKGIHLVMRARDVPVRQPLVVQVRGTKRIVFVVPWGSRTYLGTTDSAYEGDPGASGVDEADYAELFPLIRRVLPSAPLERGRVVSAWSGVRPLVRSGPPKPGSSTVNISRRHRLVENADGVVALVGGKLTTYRAMAKEAVDHVAKALRAADPERTIPRCTTHRLPLVPGAPLTAEELRDDPLLADLAPRHGPEARVLAERAQAHPELAGRLVDDLPYRWVEVDQAIRFEGTWHLDDILRRRLPLALTDARHGAGVARRIAERLVDARGGSGRDVDAEIDRYRDLLRRETGYDLNDAAG